MLLQYVYIENTSAFVPQAAIDIEVGMEITVNYGPDWFGSDCPCVDCKPDTVPHPLGRHPMSTSLSSAPLPSMRSRNAIILRQNHEKMTAREEAANTEAEESRARKRAKKAQRQRAKRRDARHTKASQRGVGDDCQSQ
jgi:hypothetical protein